MVDKQITEINKGKFKRKAEFKEDCDLCVKDQEDETHF